MKNQRIRQAYDTISPTAAQKDRMLGAILQEADFREAPVKQARKKEPVVYTARPAKTSKKSAFMAIAASLAMVAVSAAVLVQMMKHSPDPSYKAPGETTPAVTAEGPYQQILQKYESAVEEDWDYGRVQEENLSLNADMLLNYDLLGYALRDMDGDGAEELLITDGTALYDLYSVRNGQALRLWNAATRSSGYVCRGNVIASVDTTNAGALTYYHFMELKNGLLQDLEQLTYYPEKDLEYPWFDGNPNIDPNVPAMSNQDAQLVMDLYEKVYIRNISFRQGLDGAKGEDGVPENPSAYAGVVRQFMETYSYSEPMTYTFYDYDGDGSRELLLGSGNALRAVYKDVNGQIREIGDMAAQSDTYLCEEDILRDSSLRGNTFSKRDGTVVEFVYYSEETGSWYCKNKEKSVDVPISREEADKILRSFPRIWLDWKPIQDFPVSLEAETGTLFQNVFLPIARGEAGSSIAELTGLLDANGLAWKIGDEGFISCEDPQEEGTFLSAEMTSHNGMEMIWELVCMRQKQGITCQAVVRYAGEEMEYFTETDFIGAGLQVSSADSFAAFLYDEDPHLELRHFVETFVRCYSNVDASGLDSMLVPELVPVDPGTIPGHGWEFKIQQLNGLETAEADYASRGRAVVSAAYLGEPDSYTYLTMELVKLDGAWKVAAFYEEK